MTTRYEFPPELLAGTPLAALYATKSDDADPRVMLCICAYHDIMAQAEVTRLAKKFNFRVTHGVCPACAAKLDREVQALKAGKSPCRSA